MKTKRSSTFRSKAAGARKLRRELPALILCFGLFPGAVAQSPEKTSRDIADLSIEELSRIEVSSVSRKAEPVSHAAAAIHVITQEDIRRSGATTIADALRMSPGLNVARIDAR